MNTFSNVSLRMNDNFFVGREHFSLLKIISKVN